MENMNVISHLYFLFGVLFVIISRNGLEWGGSVIYPMGIFFVILGAGGIIRGFLQRNVH
ncbi:hypothetical protein [Halalkalibacter akibai]|uniref:Uncharacterized protein n=1 Tax=Halalkalibacter akibai (strain ATCC 43226 / DSM 21942 / CIP 109018 / JCM 9157 / 1139) TaxID=1236973 RepID=W4QSY9_HALA3|nr:hypothetical protein [Halalkalibacter akibai]GAE35012.1 hypothetical protein JCM9157_2104 [Halalkalibacter akibai JCM 9157]